MIASIVLTLAPTVDTTSAIEAEVQRHWAKLQDVTLQANAYRDKQRFCTDLDELLEKERGGDKDRKKAAKRLVRGLEEDAPAGYRWRVHELRGRLLSTVDAKAGVAALDEALAAYPAESYSQPQKHSSFHHIAARRFQTAWDAFGRERACADFVELVGGDERMAAVYADDLVNAFLERGAGEHAKSFFDSASEAAKGRDAKLARSLADVDVPDLRMAGGDPQKRYLVLGGGDESAKRDLVVVMPGGNGHALDFRPWMENLTSDLRDTHRFVVLSAPVWQEGQGDKVVWVTENWKREFRAKFTVEEFAREVVREMRASDPNLGNAYLFAWSSGGPATYATILDRDDTFRGAYVLASVFKPKRLDLKQAKGRRFWLQQGRADKVTPLRFAEDANEKLSKAGAETHLEIYDEGHGFAMSDPKASLAEALRWLAR